MISNNQSVLPALFYVLRQFYGLDDLARLCDHLWLDVGLELVERVPFRAEFLVLDVVELLDRVVGMRQFVYEVVFQLRIELCVHFCCRFSG